jgi:hypothetical protein
LKWKRADVVDEDEAGDVGDAERFVGSAVERCVGGDGVDNSGRKVSPVILSRKSKV